jgi:hypothetical protein
MVQAPNYHTLLNLQTRSPEKFVDICFCGFDEPVCFAQRNHRAVFLSQNKSTIEISRISIEKTLNNMIARGAVRSEPLADPLLLLV